MKKKRVFLALLLAGVMSVGAFAATGCKDDGKPDSGIDSGNTDNPGGGNTDTPGGGNTDTPGGGNTDNPGGGNTDTPGGGNTDTPGGGNTDTPGGGNTDTPGGGNTDNPGGGNTDNPGGGNTDTPGGGNTDNPGGGNTDTPGGGDVEEPVVLTEDMAISLTVGDKKTINAAAGATFNSDDATVATVNSNGEITAKTAGVAKVTATAQGSVTTCTVIVMKKLEGNSQAPSKDPFSFNVTKDIGSVSVTAPAEPVVTEADEYLVSFSDGAISQHVEDGYYAVEPVGVEKDGYYLTGWKNGSSDYDFSAPVKQQLNLTAQWKALPSGINSVQGNFESIAVEFAASASTAVQYKLEGENEWTAVDAPLVRSVGGESRVDILGLTPGKYTVKVGTTEISDIPVKAYDRSGYAHFKYTDGVGAYNDNGTIKDNVLVIYLTEENKNDVTDYCYVNGSKVDITKYITDSKGTVHKGVGEIFNNRRYDGAERATVGIQKLTETYGGVDLRVIGKVTNTMPNGKCTIIGLTDFDSTGNGGTVGDSGGMARMINAKNVTLEGVGEDATIDGWGFHLVASYNGKTAGDTTGTKADPTRGKSFEARNLTFQNYPEDALGMEGEQGTGSYDAKTGKMSGSSSVTSPIISPVERCWVHHNTFHQGGNGSAAEGDKGEGDGSCDFKRGRYFTFSYNYLDWCHKTNLQGSSDSSLQFDISMHHNWWVNCQARMPLVRNANVHLYNNYIFADMNEKPALSQVSSVRANAYLFAEANYYDGCKGVVEYASGGAAKSYANTYNSCFNGDASTHVTSRETPVSNNCKYQAGKIDYSAFDTNKEIFYYDDVANKTKGLVDDSVSARWRTIQYAGALGHGVEFSDKLLMNKATPAGSVTSGDVDLSKATPGATVNGVYSNTFSKTKGKGQLFIFNLSAPTMISVTTSTSGDTAPQVVRDDGKIFIEKFTGTESCELPAGTYMIMTGMKEKESAITALSFTEAAGASDARKEAAVQALGAIPNQITVNSKTVIDTAKKAYAALTADEKNAIDSALVDKYQKAVKAYNDVQTEYVIARIEYIGTVTEYSGNDINAAQKAYAALPAELQSGVTNYSKLTGAQATYAAYAAVNVNNYIATLPSNSTFAKFKDSIPAINLALDLFERAVAEYEALEDDAQEEVSGIAAVKADIESLKGALAAAEKAEAERQAVADFVAALATVDKNNVTPEVAREITKLYKAMPADKQTEYATNEKYVAVKAVMEAQPKSMVLVFASADHASLVNNGVTVTGAGGFKDAAEYKVDVDGDGTEESFKKSLSIGNGTVTFTVAANSKLTIFMTKDDSKGTLDSKKRLNVNGEMYNPNSSGILTVNVGEGTVTIKKGDACRVCYIIVEPAE